MSKATTFMLTVLLTATSTVSSVANSAGPASLYVAKHGSDSYTCSQAANPSTPKLTIGAALDCVGFTRGTGANKVVEVAAGTYVEAVGGPGFPSGTSWNAPFTLRAKEGDTVEIRPTGTGIAIGLWGENEPLYAIIQGFTLNGVNNTEGRLGAIYNSYVRLVGNRMLKGGIQGNGANVEFINNRFGSDDFNAYDSSNSPWMIYPIYFNGHNLLIEGNEFAHFPLFALHLYRSGDCAGHVVNNIIRNNKFSDFGWAARCPSGDPRCGGKGPNDTGFAILICGRDSQAYNNLIWNGTGAIDLYTSGPNNVAYNNTIYNMSHTGIAYRDYTQARIQNNIVYNPTRPAIGDIVNYDANTGQTIVSNNLCARSASGCEVVGNPLFVDPATGNFNLQPGSSATRIGATAD